MRDLSISLNNVGRVGLAQGDWEKTSEAYRESRQLWQRLALAFPDNPEYTDQVQRIDALLAEKDA